MAVVQHVRVFPDIGTFPPGSFDHLLHKLVTMPGLEPTWDHTVIDAEIAPGGGSALLTIHSEPQVVLSLDRSLRIVGWEPPAHIRAHDRDGNVLVETRAPAPLQPGQVVELGGDTYRVAPAEDHELWPHRHPDTGVCRGDIDWQHVTLVPEPRPAHLPALRKAT